MPLKNKTMALIRMRKTPYSGLGAFFTDLFYKQENLAPKALELLKLVYTSEVLASDWRKTIQLLFSASPPSVGDERVIDEACFKYLGFHRENLTASKNRLRGKKAYQKLLVRSDVDESTKKVLYKVSGWNSAVTKYYTILNKLKALGFVEKTSGVYVKSDKLKRRFNQVLALIQGFESEINQK